ncbi:MAG: 2-hydroxychromene-2-carboxylate isomerase, partial [Rhodoferax sp.]|nr:2-hydroxychromene-2-carboxylate isomerase [Rhodoferax sp.]
GHARFTQLAKDAGAQVRVCPIDLGAVFPVSGGLPLAKRAPQRQAYRLVEMQRFSKHLGIPINLQPQFFPVAVDPVAQLIVAVDTHDGTDAAMAFCAAVFEALWVHERNLADPAHLAALLDACGLPAERAAQAAHPDIRARYTGYTQQSIDAGVFGAPSYVVDGEIFWGQDRLDFLARALKK